MSPYPLVSQDIADRRAAVITSSMTSLKIALIGVLLAAVAGMLKLVQEVPARSSTKEELLSSEDLPVYNVIELATPVVTGRLLKVVSFLLAKSWLSPFLMRNLLNDNGAHLLRKMAIDHCEQLGPTHVPIHHVSTATMSKCQVWSEETQSIQQTGLNLKLGSPPPYYSVMDYHRLYQSKRTDPSQVMEELLHGAEALEHLHIFAYLDAADVRRQAKASTSRWLSETGPLSVWDRVPVAVKDMSPVSGMPLCVGSSQCSPLQENDDYPAARLRAAGAIIVGTTVMTEGGVTPLGYSVYFDGPFNPYNTAHYPGGSSGGSAVAVASGLVPMAVGWDGGGSIRVPSAMSGVLGLATTHGRVPFSVENAQFSVTKAGPLAATFEDLALSYLLLGGVAEDSYAAKTFHGAENIPPPHLNGLLSKDNHKDGSKVHFEGFRVGVFWDHFSDTSPEVYDACMKAVQQLQENGAKILNITIPHLREIHMSHALKITNEFALQWEDRFFDPNYQMEANTEVTLAIGRAITATDILAADKIRTWAIDYVLDLYTTQHLDAIVSPMLGTSVPKPPAGYRGYGESNTPLVYKVMRFTPLANFLGLPALVVNAGYEKETNLPIGLQLLGRPWSESRLMELGSQLQSFLPMRRRPKHFFDVLKKWQ